MCNNESDKCALKKITCFDTVRQSCFQKLKIILYYLRILLNYKQLQYNNSLYSKYPRQIELCYDLDEP